jgi:hypothetical protein
MVMLNASNRSSYSFDFVALFGTAMAGLVISAYLLSEEQGPSEPAINRIDLSLTKQKTLPMNRVFAT